MFVGRVFDYLVGGVVGIFWWLAVIIDVSFIAGVLSGFLFVLCLVVFFCFLFILLIIVVFNSCGLFIIACGFLFTDSNNIERLR